MPDASTGTEEFVLPSELDVLERVDAVTLKYCDLAGFGEHLAGMVAIAVIEAVTNAVMHGNKQSPDKAVRVRFEWAPGRLAVAVKDEGEGFDLTCVLDPTDPERCLASSGRGIYIMREIMDSVEFEIDKGSGTEVTLVKEV